MPNPFEGAMSPDRDGTLGGFLGGMMGMPTQQQRTGTATGQGMDQLQQLFQETGNAQQAFMKFIATPQGQELFMRDPKALETMANGLKMMQQPSPSVENVPAGGMSVARDPRTGAILQDKSIANPTGDVQTFSELAKIAGLDDQTKAIIAQATLLANTQKGQGSAAQALDALVAQNKLTPDMRNKIIGGAIKNVPIRNEQGAVVGEALIDLSTGQAIMQNPSIAPTVQGAEGPQQPTPGNALPAPAGQPAARPGEPKPLQKGDDALIKDPKTSMALAAGVAPVVGTTVGGLAGQVGIDLGTGEMTKRQAAMQQMRSALAEFSKIGEGMGVPARLMNEIQGLANFGTMATPAVGPKEANIQLRTLRQGLDEQIDVNEQVMRDLNQPANVRAQAGRRIQAMRNLATTMPSTTDLDRMQSMIEAGTAGAWSPSTIVDMAKKGYDQASGAVTRKGAAPVDYTKMPEEQMLSVDPKMLNNNDRVLYMNRLQELIKSKKGKGQQKPTPKSGKDELPI